MSTEQPPAKKTSRWARLLDAPRRWTLPTWATIGFVLFLVGSLVVCWGWFQQRHQFVPWYHYMTWPRLLLTCLLLFVVPYFFHAGLRLWLQGEASRFPELEKAWQVGLHALHEAGITLDSTPVFVCIGSSDELQERAIMNCNATPLSVVGVPRGPAPLHWYGNSEAVYLFCSDASWLSALNRLRREREDEVADESLPDMARPVLANGGHQGVSESAMPRLAKESAERLATSVPGAGANPLRAAPSATSAAKDFRGTMMLDSFVADSAPVRNIGAAAARTANVRGTMVLDEGEDASAEPAITETAQPLELSTSQQRQPIVVNPRDASVRLQRLQAICQRVRNARRPLCPINGILALLPFEMIHATADETEELERAVKNDLTLLREELNLRAPVTALVVGLEKESGFRELVRRVGREKSATQRFGGRFDLRAVAAADAMRSFSSHVCGAFEDWAYTLFRAKGALSRPGNTRLYSLLCKVRCILKHKLGRLLANGVGYDPRQSQLPEPHLFSGCYFAATGRSADRQAFVRGVLEKLVTEQEQIEWTDHALVLERRCRRLFTLGLAVDAALIAALVALWWR